MTVPDGSVHALLLAGQRPGPDPLAEHFGVPLKVLVSLAGEPMLSRVARVLTDHRTIGRVTILLPEPETVLADPDCAWLRDHPDVEFAPSANSISRTVLDAMGEPTPERPVLVTTGDHPLLDAAMIDDFLAKSVAAEADITFGVVEQSLYQSAMPEGRRTWLRFRGGAYSGANLFLMSGARARNAVAFWKRVEADRKKGRKIIAAFGPLLLVAVGLRLLTLPHALRLAGRRLHVNAAAIELSDPIACVDVDKVADYDLAARLIAARA